MPIIQVLIFRGTGGVLNKEHPYYTEPALVRAGHVGIIGVIEGKVIGFHPTSKSVKDVGGERSLLEKLTQHEVQAGCLQDDTSVFERAMVLVKKTNGRTTVYMYEVEISDETLKNIKTWYNDKKEIPYNFPNLDGSFKKGDSNCAVFWSNVFDIPLPLNTGSIRLLTEYMSEEGFDKWSND